MSTAKTAYYIMYGAKFSRSIIFAIFADKFSSAKICTHKILVVFAVCDSFRLRKICSIETLSSSEHGRPSLLTTRLLQQTDPNDFLALFCNRFPSQSSFPDVFVHIIAAYHCLHAEAFARDF